MVLHRISQMTRFLEGLQTVLRPKTTESYGRDSADRRLSLLAVNPAEITGADGQRQPRHSWTQ
jgi:hypothetical protein